MLDAYQETVYKKFAKTNYLSSKKNFERVVDWITFYRRNIAVCVEHYLGIPLHWYQIIWLYALNMYLTTVIIAGRASAKSFVIAIFSCVKCILYPGTKIVVASGVKKQAGLIVTEKIQKELIPKSENLRREIRNIKSNGNDTEVNFVNGSSLVIVPASENALGYRCTVLICEEFKRIKKDIVDLVLKPFRMTRRPMFLSNEEPIQLGIRYMDNPTFVEESTNIYISSAAPTSTWMKGLLDNAVKSKYSDGMSCFWATDYSIALKHQIKTMNELIDTKRTTDSLKWRQEYENEMFRQGNNNYFSYTLLTQVQKNKKAIYPQRYEEVRIKKKNNYSMPKATGEIRVLSCDMAFIERSNKNDNSCFTLIRALPESITYKSHSMEGDNIEIRNGYRRIVPYIEANPGSDVDKQAIRIKQLYYDLECDYLVLDTRNGGELIALPFGNIGVIKGWKKSGMLKCKSDWKAICKNIVTGNA